MNETVVFTVPELVRSPVLGRGCCAVASAWLIEDSLSQLPGVKKIRANDNSGEVRVCFDPETADFRQIAQTLEALGFRPDAMVRPPEAAQTTSCVE